MIVLAKYSFEDYQSKELAIKYAKLGAKFGYF